MFKKQTKIFNLTMLSNLSSYDITLSFFGILPTNIKIFKRLSFYNVNNHITGYYLSSNICHVMSEKCSSFFYGDETNYPCDSETIAHKIDNNFILI